VADDEVEGAVMVAIASAIAKDRKTSRVAVERKRAAKTMVLPVAADLPAIVVLCDEGGEMRQKANLLGQLVIVGLSRLAQIGRAEGVRVVMSILRGTADLLDKGLRVNAALRICLRMEEEDEYTHVLGSHPGSTRLLHTGSGYTRRSTDPRPVFSRSADFPRDAIERAAVALAPHRPALDERGRLVASRLTLSEALGGREPWPEVMKHQVMRDVKAGRAYEDRWVRYANKLAEMRGEDIPEDDEPGGPTEDTAGADVATGAASSLPPGVADLVGSVPTVSAPPVTAAPIPAPARAALDLDGQDVDDGARELLAGLEAPALTAREQIILILGDVWPEALTSDQIGTELERRTDKAGSRTHRQNLLRDMVDRRQIVRVEESANGGRYTLPKAP
jgi:hypothetical protein